MAQSYGSILAHLEQMSIAGSRSWEGWAPDLNNDRPAWGNLGEEANIPWDAIPPAEAGDELCNLLISLKLNGSLSARQACILAFFAFKACATPGASKSPKKVGLDFQSNCLIVWFLKIGFGKPFPHPNTEPISRIPSKASRVATKPMAQVCVFK